MFSVHICRYNSRPMPDIDTLMQEWSPEFEELLGKVSGRCSRNLESVAFILGTTVSLFLYYYYR